jgi:phospholipid/cholesterol/gamma-HCH transport system substrate-binding protein
LDSKRQVRIAAAVLAALMAIGVLVTYLGYTAAFTATDRVTVFSPRAGLVMDPEAKVKYRGIQIGKVKSIDYRDNQARLTLAIERSQLPYIPSNTTVQIAGNTIFGAKSVEFLPAAEPSGKALRPGAVVQASAVQLEVNTLFQTLTDVLNKIDPVKVNGTLSALAEGLRGNGDNLGATLAGLNSFLAQLNPKLPTMESDISKAATVADTYADVAPDLVTILDNAPILSRTIVDQRDNLNATLLAATGLGNNGYDTLAPAADDYIAAIHRLRAPLKVTGEYSPEFGCLLKALSTATKRFGPALGGTKPGLFVDANFPPGAPAYTYPESLPLVNASGGPNCRGLPDIPSKQYGGSWYRAPFLVTDSAYVPFQPNTELQWDAPSVVQFLFNGAYAERDDYFLRGQY